MEQPLIRLEKFRSEIYLDPQPAIEMAAGALALMQTVDPLNQPDLLTRTVQRSSRISDRLSIYDAISKVKNLPALVDTTADYSDKGLERDLNFATIAMSQGEAIHSINAVVIEELISHSDSRPVSNFLKQSASLTDATARIFVLGDFFINRAALQLLEHTAYVIQSQRNFNHAREIDISKAMQKIPQSSSEQLRSAEILRLLTLSNRLEELGPGKANLVPKNLAAYERWQELGSRRSLFFNSLLATMMLSVDAKKPETSTEQREAITIAEQQAQRHEAEQLKSHKELQERYDVLIKPFRTSNASLKKLGFRPVSTALMKPLAADSQEIARTEGMVAANFKVLATRLTSVLLQVHHLSRKQLEELKTYLKTLVAEERALATALEESAKSIATENKTVPPTETLHSDIMWLAKHWKTTVHDIVIAQWPSQRPAEQNTENVAVQLRTVLTAFTEAYNDNARAPERRLFELARHVGKPTLIPEARARANQEVFKVATTTMRSSLQKYGHGKGGQTNVRTEVVLQLMQKSDKDALETMDNSFGLYVTDKKEHGHNRYFIIKFKDDHGRAWYILETLDANRATYAVPLAALEEHEGPFRQHPSEDQSLVNSREMEAVLGHSKINVQAMGELSGFQAQIIHSKDTTPKHHITKIMQHCNDWRPKH